MKRLAAALAMLLIASCSAQTSSTLSVPEALPANSASVPAGLSAYYSQQVHWRSCSGGQCAQVKVPIDYGHPSRGSLALAVFRHPANSPASRIGALLVNPGGPGGSAVTFARDIVTALPAQVVDDFDIVGVDPRGVGQSEAPSCLPAAQMDQYVASLGPQAGAAGLAVATRWAHAFAAGCARSAGSLLGHLSTATSARDMDLVRAVLGERQLTFLGLSYGTYLGAWYARLFPGNVRAMILDGAVDPQLDAVTLDDAQAAGFEQDLLDFLSWCGKGHGCPSQLGAARQWVASLIDRLARTPLPDSGSGRQVTAGTALLGIALALYLPAEGWPLLASALVQATQGVPGPLLSLADQYAGRASDGSYSTELSSELAVTCLDLGFPRQSGDVAHVLARARAIAPLFGELNILTSLPCSSWATASQSVTSGWTVRPAAPVLVIGTTRDPATPYAWARALSADLIGSRLLTYVGDGHTASLRGDNCVDEIEATYLVSGTLPSVGARCPSG